MFNESVLLMFVELIEFALLEAVELSCVGPSKEDGGARSGLGLSDAILWTAIKASCGRRRTIVSWEDDEAVLTDTVLLVVGEILDSLQRCVRPTLLSGAFEFVDWRREVFEGKCKLENMRLRKRRLLDCAMSVWGRRRSGPCWRGIWCNARLVDYPELFRHQTRE
jgi:hypothetical protein